MARLDTRSITGIPEEWLASDSSAELPEFDLGGESAEIREWRMIVAFLQNC